MATNNSGEGFTSNAPVERQPTTPSSQSSKMRDEIMSGLVDDKGGKVAESEGIDEGDEPQYISEEEPNKVEEAPGQGFGDVELPAEAREGLPDYVRTTGDLVKYTRELNTLRGKIGQDNGELKNRLMQMEETVKRLSSGSLKPPLTQEEYDARILQGLADKPVETIRGMTSELLQQQLKPLIDELKSEVGTLKNDFTSSRQESELRDFARENELSDKDIGEMSEIIEKRMEVYANPKAYKNATDILNDAYDVLTARRARSAKKEEGETAKKRAGVVTPTGGVPPRAANSSKKPTREAALRELGLLQEESEG